MEHSTNHQPKTDSSGVAPVRDLRRLRREGTASIGELRDFVRQMRGRSPQEVLGAVAQSSLVQGVALATLGTALLIAVLTVGPYMLRDAKAEPSAKAPAAATPSAPANDPAATAAQSPATITPSTDPAAPATASPDALRRLGIDEVKESDPTVNPLDGGADDLLDGLD